MFYRWLSSIDDKPGISTHAISSLKEKVLKDPAAYKNCTLLIDGMAIKKHIQYSKSEGRHVGYVDVGGGLLEEDNRVATEAIVLMAVGLNKKWKVPISFHLTAGGCAAEIQKTLLLSAIQALYDIGINVRVLTLDGCWTNQSTLDLLGCDIVNNKTSFVHPTTKQEVYAMLDPVHMIKVLRNCFGDLKYILGPDGVAEWQHILNLVEMQEKGELRLGNKLNRNHIEYSKNIMKVKLAAQIFSLSTADALLTMKRLTEDGGEWSTADQTAKLLKVSILQST